MPPNTHLGINKRLCGTPATIGPGTAVVRLATTADMAADDQGLVHGGFVFGAADYAAMLAVNDPNVVLGAADTRFLAPVRRGQMVECRAEVVARQGRKISVYVQAKAGETTVMTGTFTCFALPQHILAEKTEDR